MFHWLRNGARRLIVDTWQRIVDDILPPSFAPSPYLCTPARTPYPLQHMRTLALFLLIFGLVTIVLGVVGFTNAGSLVSLATGVGTGIALVGAGLATQKGSRKGMIVGLIVSVSHLGWFGSRLVMSAGTQYPAVILTAMAGVAIILTVLILVQPKKRERIF